MPGRASPLRRATARVQRDTRARITRLRSINPDWRPLLEIVADTLAALESHEPWWDLPAVTAAVARNVETPLLHRARILIDPGRAEQLVRRLVSAAGIAPRRGGLELDSHRLLALLAAAVAEDLPRLSAQARELELPEGGLLAVARHAIIPALCDCAVQLADTIQPDWHSGYCPVCGAWPLLAEQRGLEQARRLRCGRCATDWAGDWLCCCFCGERDHHRLSSLVPQAGPGPRVESCASCRGYLKILNTLLPLSVGELLLSDLESVELDLTARAAGFVRPEGFAVPLDLELFERRDSPSSQ